MTALESTLVMSRVGELWLKGNNRRRFTRQLRRNLDKALAPVVPEAVISARPGRLFVEVPEPAQVRAALAVCADTPGLIDVCAVVKCPPTLDDIEATALGLVERSWLGARGSFAIDGSRAHKKLPFTSPQMNTRVGAAVQSATGLAVDLAKPDRTLHIEVGSRHAYLWLDARPGAGGLPVGTAGHALLLLSGGIDSPVAGYLAQKRGCRLEAVYFHSPPYVGEGTKEKVLGLARRLARRQAHLIVHVVPFTAVQLAIREMCDPRLLVVLYRRMMYRIADRIAADREIDALCTGEMLGQVASQTLGNLRLVDALTDRIVLRPLMTHDKQESIDLARRIGTYETSIAPYDDCCALFLADFPATKASPAIVRRQEDLLDIEKLVDAAVADTERIRV